MHFKMRPYWYFSSLFEKISSKFFEKKTSFLKGYQHFKIRLKSLALIKLYERVSHIFSRHWFFLRNDIIFSLNFCPISNIFLGYFCILDVWSSLKGVGLGSLFCCWDGSSPIKVMNYALAWGHSTAPLLPEPICHTHSS